MKQKQQHWNVGIASIKKSIKKIKRKLQQQKREDTTKRHGIEMKVPNEKNTYVKKLN